MNQINRYIKSQTELQRELQAETYAMRRTALEVAHRRFVAGIASQAKPEANGHYQTAYLMSQLRKFCPADTIWCIEAVTQTQIVADQIQATLPGSWVNCGGGGLGWSGGAALGMKLAADTEMNKQFVCQIVGDGTFLFSVPGSVYWIAKRYNIPILTVVLNNHGWNAPKNSLLLVHPHGEGSKVTNSQLNISFEPTPDYAGIAKAAAGGDLWAIRTGKAEDLARLLPEAVEKVKRGIPVVLDAHLNGSTGKYVGEQNGRHSGVGKKRGRPEE